MKRTRYAVFPAVAFAAVCLILSGQPLPGAKTFKSKSGKEPKAPEQAFSKRDSGRDGKLTLSEFQRNEKKAAKVAKSSKKFTKYDVDGDGSVSLAEFTARQGRHGEKKR